MAAQSLQPKRHHQPIPSVKQNNYKTKPRANPKPNRSISSLLVITTIPLSLITAIIYSFGSGRRYHILTKPVWFPSLGMIHLASGGSTLSMSLAAWLVWTSGGFSLRTDPLPLYIAQVSLSIVWDPLVLRIGAASVGFVFCIVHFCTLVACHWMFGRVDSSSKHFVKPCVVWAGYLTAVTFKLMHL